MKKNKATRRQALCALALMYPPSFGRRVRSKFNTQSGALDFRKKEVNDLVRAFYGDRAAAAAFVEHIINTSLAREQRRELPTTKEDEARLLGTFSPADVRDLRWRYGVNGEKYGRKFMYVPERGGAVLRRVDGERDYAVDETYKMSQAKCELINRLMGWRG